MAHTRREFGKYAGIAAFALASGGSVELAGCTSSVFSNILAWIPIGISAISGIVTVLDGLVPPQALLIITLVKAGMADLAAAVTQYNADNIPADKATLLAKIRTLLTDVVANFQDFLNALNLGNNPILAIVLGLAQVVISALMGFLGQLPAAGTALSSTLRLDGKNYPVVPHFYKTTIEFKTAYNSVASSNGHPEIEIH